MFLFDPLTGEYQRAVGQSRANASTVPSTAVRVALDKYLDRKTNQITALAEQLRNREITIAEFQKQTRELIAQSHLSAAIAAKGGKGRMTHVDYGRVGALIKSEYWQLQKLAIEIEGGLPLDGRFMQRMVQYASAPRHSYHVVESREMKARGMDEQKFIRHSGDSCESCVMLAALGYHEVGSTPEPGDIRRKCRRKCRCGKKYRKSRRANS